MTEQAPVSEPAAETEKANSLPMSIAMKITGSILWAFMLTSFIISIMLQGDVEKELKQEISSSADNIAYGLTNILAQKNILSSEQLKSMLGGYINKSEFSAIELRISDQKILVGEVLPEYTSQERTIPQVFGSLKLISTGGAITLYHLPLKSLIHAERISALAKFGGGLFAFGLFLTWLIHFIVIRPIQELVSATRAVSDGDLDLQLDIKRQDEFGDLTRFFNQMLHRLSDQHHDLEHALENAKAANNAKSTFLANMSHELRTPLNAVIGYSEMLQEDAVELGMQQMVPDLQTIQISGNHLLSLINDILDISKIEAGRMEIFVEEFEILSFINDISSTISPLLKKNHNSLDILCAPDIGNMYSDIIKARQSLINLISNACKFTHHGKIILEVSKAKDQNGNWVRFSVKDSGIGMTKEQVDKLFQAFTQADASTTRKYGGTGLGLAISKKFCELMGGNIYVNSKLNEGSIFTMMLPEKSSLAYGEDNEALPSPASVRFPKDLSRLIVNDERRNKISTVLIIDDDPIVRDIMRRVLTKEGFRVEVAYSGEKGLQMVKEIRPDVITLDVMMPDINGWIILKALKKDPDLADIPVIMQTMVDDREMGFALGVSEYLVKPVERDRLTTVVKKCLRKEPSGNILVIGANDSNHESLIDTLEGQGYNIIITDIEDYTIEQAGESSPVLMIIELLAANTNAFKLIQELKENAEAKDVPVIILTDETLTTEMHNLISESVTQIWKKDRHEMKDLIQEVHRLARAPESLSDRGNSSEIP